MNKHTANIAYYGSFVVALLISYGALSYAGDLAYSGKQPIIWVSLLAFFGVVLLVLFAIYIKLKHKL